MKTIFSFTGTVLKKAAKAVIMMLIIAAIMNLLNSGLSSYAASRSADHAENGFNALLDATYGGVEEVVETSEN